jgi:hypothetical protein
VHYNLTIVAKNLCTILLTIRPKCGNVRLHSAAVALTTALFTACIKGISGCHVSNKAGAAFISLVRSLPAVSDHTQSPISVTQLSPLSDSSSLLPVSIYLSPLICRLPVLFNSAVEMFIEL